METDKTKTFNTKEGGFYTVTVDASQVKMDCYSMGSPAGGTGTECSHTVNETKVPDFFAVLGVKGADDLMMKLESYEESDWDKLHSLISKNQSDSFVWVETDWSDSIEIKVTLTGEAKVGSVLSADATARSINGTFPVAYQWYSNDELTGSYNLIESATESTYPIMPRDLRKFIRVVVSSSDTVGFNSSSHPSKSVGPVE